MRQMLMKLYEEILEVNPTAILTGSMALAFQKIRLRREPCDLDIIIPKAGGEFVLIPGLEYKTEEDTGIGETIYEGSPYICKKYYYMSDNIETPSNSKKIVVDVFLPKYAKDVYPDYYETHAGLKIAMAYGICEAKIRGALNIEYSGRHKHVIDLIYIILNNSDFDPVCFKELAVELLEKNFINTYSNNRISHMLRLSRPLVFFDTETTGTDTVNDRILEISAIKIHPYGEKETITQRINPTRPIPKEASNVHGIYDSDVENMPTFYEYKNTVIDFFKDCDVAGFNILSYDVPILVEEILRAEGDEPFDEKTKFIDALKIYHENEKRDLSSAYKFYCDKNLEGAHGAEADTNATIEVLEKQIVKYGLPNTVEELHEISNKGNAIVDYGRKFVRNQKGNIVFSFGKHKDESVHRHFDYLKWMLGADFSKHTKYIIRQILNGNFGKEQSEYPKDLFL